MTTAEQVIYSFIESGVNKTAKSISIQAFKFRDTQKLGLTCTARMCKAGDDSCAAPTDCDAVRAAPAAPTEATTTTTTTTAAPTAPTPPAGGTRKKRAADDVTEETVSTVVTVLNPGETLVSTSTVAGNKTSVADPETCLAHGSIVSVIAILGGLVGILLLACLALACVIMRRREPKLLESVAHSGFAIPRAHTNGAYTREY
ncbi:hypothetical protein DPMN_031815 [Dreissena polymorpha]|uniref:ZP domain-containing protein n=2 Tax=Dreissena polymorpha TaxID=45954 RepID=A0A9D4RHN7_DREPO|nr:hypothetical protein DPMN_031815 [Dreissena polymorpha]